MNRTKDIDKIIKITSGIVSKVLEDDADFLKVGD